MQNSVPVLLSPGEGKPAIAMIVSARVTFLIEPALVVWSSDSELSVILERGMSKLPRGLLMAPATPRGRASNSST